MSANSPVTRLLLGCSSSDFLSGGLSTPLVDRETMNRPDPLFESLNSVSAMLRLWGRTATAKSEIMKPENVLGHSDDLSTF